MSVSSIRTPHLELIPFDPIAIRRLIEGDRPEAERVLGRIVPDEFPNSDELEGFLPIQLQRMGQSPRRREWMARLMVSETLGVVGHCGFHGAPETIGRAEIGYTVFEPFRGRGFAREAAGALVKWAFEHGEKKVFATVSPDNAPSLAVVRAIGFQQVGTQQDEVDGLELVFTMDAPAG
ncbi:MAG: GNAT family N-acetyltransferase [Chloroflexi bacterium]|nr:MAG: GNAT family N-acetyltransferase [Chloroflexota bacterium]